MTRYSPRFSPVAHRQIGQLPAVERGARLWPPAALHAPPSNGQAPHHGDIAPFAGKGAALAILGPAAILHVLKGDRLFRQKQSKIQEATPEAPLPASPLHCGLFVLIIFSTHLCRYRIPQFLSLYRSLSALSLKPANCAAQLPQPTADLPVNFRCSEKSIPHLSAKATPEAADARKSLLSDI